MLFNSLTFLIFIPIVWSIFVMLPVQWRSRWMLLASYYFYCSWSIWMGGLLMLTTLFDWWMAKKMEANPLHKKNYLILSIGVNLGLLLSFKIFGHDHLFHQLWQAGEQAQYFYQIQHLAIPIGISFYTFQSMSYIIDVYKGRVLAEKQLEKYALYISFFPQLVAGPIERYQNLRSQFHFNIKLPNIDFTKAAQYIIYGYFKKLVIADRVGEYVDMVFMAPENFSAGYLTAAALGFAIQVNCDFSGYCDIATGIAKLFGIDLSINFRQALLSTSFKSFWQKHHISLNQWFRDYVYLPLGGVSEKKWIWIRNIFIVFVLSGLWHGFAINYFVWGLLLAFIFVVERPFEAHIKKNTFSLLLGAVYFLSVHSFLIVLVRSQTWDKAITFYQSLFHPISNASPISLSLFTIYFTLFLIIVFFILEWFQSKTKTSSFSKKLIVNQSIYMILTLLIFIAGRFNTNLFIYFQF